jgi:hypothetical protein
MQRFFADTPAGFHCARALTLVAGNHTLGRRSNRVVAALSPTGDVIDVIERSRRTVAVGADFA